MSWYHRYSIEYLSASGTVEFDGVFKICSVLSVLCKMEDFFNLIYFLPCELYIHCGCYINIHPLAHIYT